MDIGKLIEHLSEAIDENTLDADGFKEDDPFYRQEDAYNTGVLDAWEAVRDYLDGLK